MNPSQGSSRQDDFGRPQTEDAAPLASVLVVDDHPNNLVAMRAVLEPLGHRLVMAGSGEEALRCLLRETFALILLDVQMAGMDGLETAALIKQAERTRHIPIIFLTAVSHDAKNIYEGYREGAVDYLLKPIDPEALRAKVSVFVDLYLQAEEIKRQASLLVENARLYQEEHWARTEAEAAIRVRQDVLAVVTHDLRSPLSTISVGAHSMLDALPQDEANAGHRKRATMILRAAERMNRLIEDLLDASRIEGGGLSLECAPTATNSLVDQAVEALQPLVEQRAQRLVVENEAGDASVLCDRARVVQVFSNLVGNAIKFTPEQGTITLRTVRAGGMVQFSIADNGPGIASDQLPHIFERYWQARKADQQGIGLGLVIAKGIVEAHGGTMSVTSSPAGTTFTFTLRRP